MTMVSKKKAVPDLDKSKGEIAKPHEILLGPAVQNAVAISDWGKYAGEVDLSALAEDLRKMSDKVKAGNMGAVESLLFGQAMALQTMFTSLARRSALNAGQHIDASETYMKLALKAQSQCRATLETLAIVKNPQPYIKQANITNGPQQVNNGVPVASHAEKNESLQNELLEDSHGGTYLDSGAASAPTGSHTAMATLETLHGAYKR